MSTRRPRVLPPVRLGGLLEVEELPPGEQLPSVMQVATGFDPDCRPYRAFLAGADRTLFVLVDGRPARRATLHELIRAVLAAAPFAEEDLDS